jgi:predicted small integral membrane protein
MMLPVFTNFPKVHVALVLLSFSSYTSASANSDATTTNSPLLLTAGDRVFVSLLKAIELNVPVAEASGGSHRVPS